MATVEEINAAAAVQAAAATVQNTHEAALEAKRTKLQAVQMADNLLRENRRLAPAGSDDITAEAVVTYAGTLEAYVNG